MGPSCWLRRVSRDRGHYEGTRKGRQSAVRDQESDSSGAFPDVPAILTVRGNRKEPAMSTTPTEKPAPRESIKHIDEPRLESDLSYRFGYLAEFMGFGPDDIATIHAS